MKKHTNLIFSLAVFAVTLVFYILTLAPTVSFTDSGELAAVASTLGVAHPTGYPLFTIIGYLWTLLPLPLTSIVKLNLLSAVLTAASNVVFFLTFKSVAIHLLSLKRSEKVKIEPKTKGRQSTKAVENKNVDELDTSSYDQTLNLISAILALALGFSQTVWDQAVAVEVYSLHFLMLNISLFFGLKAYINNDFKQYLYAALFVGLSFSNHLTTLLILPPLIFLFFSTHDKGFDFSGERLKQFLVLLLPLAVGLSVYLYMPIRSSMSPEFDWGGVSRGFDKFIYHVTGKQYQVWMFTGLSAWAENFSKFFGASIYVFGILIFAPFMIALNRLKIEKNKLKWAGIFLLAPIALPLEYLARKNKTVLWFVLIMIISGILYSFNYSIHDIEPYFYSAYWAIFMLIGISLVFYAKNFKGFSYSLVMVPILLLTLNYRECDRSEDYAVEEFTRILADNLPKNAIIISAQWDYWTSAFWYMQKVEGYRPDVVIIEKELMRRTWYPVMFERWYPEIARKSRIETANFQKDLELFESGGNYNPMSIQSNFVALFDSYVEKNIAERPIYMTLDVMQTDQDIAKNYFKLPQGFAFRLTKVIDTVEIDLRKMDIRKFEKSLAGKKGHLYDGIRQTAAVNFVNIAKYGAMTGQKSKALEAVKTAIRLDPKNPEADVLIRELKN